MPRIPRRCARLIATVIASSLFVGIAGPTGVAAVAGPAPAARPGGPAGPGAAAASSGLLARVGSEPGDSYEPRATLDAAFAYLSPRPGAILVQPGTTLILRPRERQLVIDLPWSTTTVAGTVSGTHPGRWEIA
ncbi:MAG: hypothetical protein KC729_19350 [Candidatus Eisenbacteria bacterium]|uniref:Uncharacterized protein n=1 Tax=Eiseniibacteriota bacterium TaxID=2212470 RepID=A0A956M2G6_UNCEI|nr:hypothetical protein [Candidatus Eisenbacteria bacterium]